jgi:UDP-MurNAc hydroxylase
MKIQMIGHASIFVETQDCKILMDPVLFDPHTEGIEDVCPKREVVLQNIPEFDILVISHKHLDHFDIRSLAVLPKNVDVLIPKDKLIESCLRKLGYSQIYPLTDFKEVKIGSTRLITTRSENRVPEFGILFIDPSGVFWNQVDSVVGLKTISKVKSLCSQVDFLLAHWQPMLEINYQTNQSIEFPYAMYSSVLQKISLIKPKALAPGANGFKFIGASDWLNQITFPVTREQFCQDVKQVYPEINERVFALDPGDTINIDRGDLHYQKDSSCFVKTIDDDLKDLCFLPTNVGNNLVDRNPDKYDLDEMKKVIEQEINFELPKFIIDNQESLFIEHFHWQVIYQLIIIYPNCVTQYCLDFARSNVESKSGYNPLANFFTTITASSLYSLIKNKKSWDYANLGGNWRTFKKVYRPNYYGLIKPEENQLQDLLQLRFPYQEIFEKVRYQEVEMHKLELDNDNNKSKYIMIEMGDSLIRLAKISDEKKKQNQTLQTIK